MLERVVFVQWVKAGGQRNTLMPTQAAGVHNYTGYIGGPDGRLIIGYFETPDLARATRALAASDANTRWAQKIVPLMETGGDISNGSMGFLTPVWRIE